MTPVESPWYWDGVNLFDNITADTRAHILAQAERQIFKRGATVFRADDRANKVFILDQGLVKIYHLSDQGEITIFWYCVPGDLFGAGGISGTMEQSVFGQAHEKSVVYALPRARFEKLVHQYPQLGLNALRLMGARLRLACDAVTDRITRKSDARLARILMRLAKNWGEQQGDGTVHFRVRITHQELASLLGSCRQTVNRLLNNFVDQGVIRFERRTLIVTDAGVLATISQGRSPSTEP